MAESNTIKTTDMRATTGSSFGDFVFGLGALYTEARVAKYNAMANAAEYQRDVRQTATPDTNIDARTDEYWQRDLRQNLFMGFSQMQVITGLFVGLVGLLAVKAWKG